LITSLSGAAAARGRSVYLLGGLPGAAQAAAAKLHAQFPSLNVAGHHCPPLGFENDPAQMELIISKLAAAQPDIVYVALGSPKQERLIAMLRLVLPQAWWLGVGMSFSFLAGDVCRAPAWMRKSGLEWVHRLAQEPRRLFKRYIVFGIPFALKLLGESALRGIGGRLGKTSPTEIAPQLSPSPCTQGEGWGGGSSAFARSATMSAPPTPAPTPTSPPSPQAYPVSSARLRGLVILSASAPMSPLTAAAGRSSLDLPVESAKTILHLWAEQANTIAAESGLDHLPLRVLLARNAMAPRSAAEIPGVTIERDLSDHHGDAELLANLAGEYDDRDLLLVAHAGQIPCGDFAGAILAASRIGAMAAIFTHEHSIPGGLMLLSGRALRLIPSLGAVDINEQLLPALAAQDEVPHFSTAAPLALPVRTADEYVRALRHVRDVGKTPTDPLAEDWDKSFSLIEAGAEVDKTARLHDAIILSGGSVASYAVVSRSVVCSGGVVPKDSRALDRIVVAGE
jgi:N-acetylglucosaminyldiphosphoundecaprenol N-acetyl-beta-D-mannosaminyltransferase